MASLIVHPDVHAGRTRLARLRAELADLLEERIRLTVDELPALRHRYSDLFGTLEREIQQRTVALSERKRMVELFALKIDRGQPLDAKTIELTMKAVYREFERMRGRVRREARNAETRAEGNGWSMRDTVTYFDPGGIVRSKQTTKEAQAIYRRLAKRLHPDTCRDHNPLTATYWELIRQSYERGDLQTLRSMENMVATVGGADDVPASAIENEERRLRDALRSEREKIASINETEPFSIRKEMSDSGWVEERRSTMQAELAAIENEIAKCDRFLAPILASHGEPIEPETVQNKWANFVEDVYLSGRY